MYLNLRILKKSPIEQLSDPSHQHASPAVILRPLHVGSLDQALHCSFMGCRALDGAVGMKMQMPFLQGEPLELYIIDILFIYYLYMIIYDYYISLYIQSWNWPFWWWINGSGQIIMIH